MMKRIGKCFANQTGFRSRKFGEDRDHMKKAICLLLVVVITCSFSGCFGVFGGNNRRNIGGYASIYTDGQVDYLGYDVPFTPYGYIGINGDAFSFYKKDQLTDLTEKENQETSAIVQGNYLEHFGNGLTVQTDYEYLGDLLLANIGDCKNFETVVLKNGDQIYGAVNCYNRASGRSGNLLSHEDFDKSYFFTVKDQTIEIAKEMEGTAVLAFNSTYYIGYDDKIIYSADWETHQKIEICKDIWWDDGPTFYNYVRVYFTEDYFVIYGEEDGGSEDNITLIAGTMDGTLVETFKDNQIVG